MSTQHTPKPPQWEARRWCHGDNSYTRWQPCTEAQMQAWRTSNGGFEFRRAPAAKATTSQGEGTS